VPQFSDAEGFRIHNPSLFLIASCFGVLGLTAAGSISGLETLVAHSTDNPHASVPRRRADRRRVPGTMRPGELDEFVELARLVGRYVDDRAEP
jgi:hypothetical protein